MPATVPLVKRCVNDRHPSVSIRELSRCPGDVLRHVAAGERLFVCRHGKPVATLQPLDGYVFQPFTGTAHDVFGWPIGNIDGEIAKLTEAQRVILVHCYSQWRLRMTRLRHYCPDASFSEEIRDMHLRGLVVRTEFGWELTGRGLALREELLRRER